jgi:hypothetical protein
MHRPKLPCWSQRLLLITVYSLRLFSTHLAIGVGYAIYTGVESTGPPQVFYCVGWLIGAVCHTFVISFPLVRVDFNQTERNIIICQ